MEDDIAFFVIYLLFRVHIAIHDFSDSSCYESCCCSEQVMSWFREVHTLNGPACDTLSPFLDPVHSDGKLEIVVPSFVHYLEVLEGSDGEKLAGIVFSLLGCVPNTGLDVI